MTLREVLRSLGSFSGEATIIAAEPWTPASAAVVREFSAALPVAMMTDDGLTYFLEVSVAREVQCALIGAGWTDSDALCDRVIAYAINDA
jgi:hypothetical protein